MPRWKWHAWEGRGTGDRWHWRLVPALLLTSYAILDKPLHSRVSVYASVKWGLCCSPQRNLCKGWRSCALHTAECSMEGIKWSSQFQIQCSCLVCSSQMGLASGSPKFSFWPLGLCLQLSCSFFLPCPTAHPYPILHPLTSTSNFHPIHLLIPTPTSSLSLIPPFPSYLHYEPGIGELGWTNSQVHRITPQFQISALLLKQL